MNNSRTLLILLGLAGAVGLGAVLLGGEGEDTPAGGDQLRALRNRVRSHLEVSDDCSSVELVGDANQYGADLEALMEIALPVARERGLVSASELAEFMLVQVLPECEIPPLDGFDSRPDLSLLFIDMRGRIIALGEALPDGDDLDEEGTDVEEHGFDPDFDSDTEEPDQGGEDDPEFA